MHVPCAAWVLQRAGTMRVLSDHAGAEALFKRALDVDPGHIPSLYCYSHLLAMSPHDGGPSPASLVIEA
ncbi:hypothetical protein T484DRAFT_1788904 [Baffinella frigidus]|nr:hypothetical protein T484DRAFT_1788904 [Cryptophyta sp. CCMP2293]